MIAAFEQTLGTELAEIPRLADGFTAWAETSALQAGDVFHVNLVLEELATNVIRHGLGEGRPGWIRVRVWREAAELHAELRDNAPPFDPFEVPPPSLTGSIEERTVGGLGVHFVRTLMDAFGYVREGDHNVVFLRKVLKGVA